MANEKKDKYLAFFEAFADGEEALKDVSRAHETIGEKVDSISTGSYALDDALSSGGYPNSRVIQLYGAAGSGKTLLAMIGIVEAQKKDPTSHQMFIDAEQTFSETWATQLGVDTSRVLLVQGDMAVNGRKCFEMLLGVPKEDLKTHTLKGKSKEGLLDKIAAGELNINLIVLDSLGAIIPPGEDTSAVGKMNMALLSRFLTTTFRKLSLELGKANIPFIVINHTRSQFDSYASIQHTYAGGNSYTHFLSANIYFEPVNRADAKILDDKDRKIGQTIRATVEKSKFGAWPRRCEFKVSFDTGIIDRHEEIAQLAIDYGVIEKPSSVSYTFGNHKWVGMPKLLEAVEGDSNLAEELLAKIELVRESRINVSRSAQKALSAQIAEASEKDDNKKSKRVDQ
jgi:recombination protein RecA